MNLSKDLDTLTSEIEQAFQQRKGWKECRYILGNLVGEHVECEQCGSAKHYEEDNPCPVCKAAGYQDVINRHLQTIAKSGTEIRLLRGQIEMLIKPRNNLGKEEGE